VNVEAKTAKNYIVCFIILTTRF